MEAKLLDKVDIERVDSLIPEAVRFANEAVKKQYSNMTGGAPGKWPDAAKNQWNQAYHDHMDTLAKAEGLRY